MSHASEVVGNDIRSARGNIENIKLIVSKTRQNKQGTTAVETIKEEHMLSKDLSPTRSLNLGSSPYGPDEDDYLLRAALGHG